MGSAGRLQQMRDGAALDSVLNAGRLERYHLQRLGDGAILESMKNKAYQIAIKKDGVHHGWYLQQQSLTDIELEKGIKSFAKQINKHQEWIKNPYLKIKDFDSFHPDRQTHLIERKWPQDIQRQQDQMAILQGILKERKNG